MRQDTLLGRLGTALSFTAGFQVEYLVGLILLSFFVVKNVPADPANMPLAIVIADGQPVTRLFSYIDPSNKWDFRTLDGQPIQLREKQRLMWGGTLLVSEAYPQPLFTRQASWSITGLLLNENQSEPWYFVRRLEGARQTGYFVAYSNFTRAPVRYLGTQGSSTTMPSPDQQFQLRSSADILTEQGVLSGYQGGMYPLIGSLSLLTSDGCYRVDLKNQTTKKIISATDLVGMSRLTTMQHELGNFGQSVSPAEPLLVRGPDTIYQFVNDQIIAQYKIPAELIDRGCNVYPVDKNTIYYAATLGKKIHSMYVPHDLLKCDAAGQTLQTWKIKQPENSAYDNTSAPQLSNYLLGILLFPAPAEMLFTLGFDSPGPHLTRLDLVRIIWPSLLLLIVCGVLSAIGAWLLAPRFSGAPLEWGWLAFVFVFGLPGLIGYLMHFRHRRRAVLEPAPKLGNEVFA